MKDGTGMARSHMVKATLKGRSSASGSPRSQGEFPGSGSIHAAVLNERPNISNNRNQGPERGHSSMGSSSIPVANQASRNTGRIS